MLFSFTDLFFSTFKDQTLSVWGRLSRSQGLHISGLSNGLRSIDQCWLYFERRNFATCKLKPMGPPHSASALRLCIVIVHCCSALSVCMCTKCTLNWWLHLVIYLIIRVTLAMMSWNTGCHCHISIFQFSRVFYWGYFAVWFFFTGLFEGLYSVINNLDFYRVIIFK